jgi:hypothetical protein
MSFRMPMSAAALRLICAVLLTSATAAAALADPPARVGRLSDIEGTVSFHTADQDQWSPATLNYPVTTGNSFYTDANARAEIQVGAATLRLDHATAADIARLDDAATQIQLDQGAINLNVMALPPGGIAVLTPLGEVDLVQPGIYDIDAGQPDGDQPPSQVQLTVIQGNAHIVAPPSDIQTGYAAIIAGNPPAVTLSQAGANEFDNWAAARDSREAAAQAPRYVSAQMTGYEDLGTYGRWVADPNYGQVWYPSGVVADWAPYRYGHWAYVVPWGWTWIDDAPWGFAPFHYGRWAYAGNGWCWVPGAIVATPVYAPALVAFIGGGGWGVSIGVGAPLAAIGWVPLGPDEVFRPYYSAGYGYVRNVNVANVNRTVINTITINNYNQPPAGATVARFRNRAAATVIPAASFTHAAPVHQATLRVAPQQLGQVQVRPSLAQIAPTPMARAGIADPRAATALVPRPNQPATVARQPVAAAALPSALANQPVPKAPGPAFHPQPAGRPGFRPTPAAAPAVAPRPAPTQPGVRAAPTVNVIPPPERPSPAAQGVRPQVPPQGTEAAPRGPRPPPTTPAPAIAVPTTPTATKPAPPAAAPAQLQAAPRPTPPPRPAEQVHAPAPPHPPEAPKPPAQPAQAAPAAHPAPAREAHPPEKAPPEKPGEEQPNK